MSEYKWYVVNAVVGHENKVAQSIRAEAEKKSLSHLFEQVLVPSVATTEIRRGRKYNVEKKIFPGYVLIKVILNDESWNLVENIRYVAKFLGNNNKPIEISEEEVARMLQHITDASAVIEKEDIYQVGELIKIIDGPFEGFTAAIDEVDGSRNRLKVSVSIFSRETLVDLEFHQVRKES